jgi:antitoxin component YwqK of YwqJK toxin-antitoxin module
MLKSRIVYRDGTIVEKRYHLDGVTASHKNTTRVDGTCKIQEWSENNTKIYSCRRKDNVIIGTECGWHINGRKAFTREYVNGRRHGESLSWYEDGNPMSKGYYTDGKLNGLCQSWSNGGGHTKEMWVNGMHHGFSEYWWSSPREINIDGMHLNNITYCATAWYEDTKLTTTFHHRDGNYLHKYE